MTEINIAHDIKSSYEDFRLHLISLLENISGEKYEDYDFTDSSNIITIDYSRSPENDILTLLYFLSCAEELRSLNNSDSKEIKWKNIEESVGELNYDEFSWIFIDESDIDKEYRANWINEDMFSPYIDVLMKIPEYFEGWIKQVDISNPNRIFFTASSDISSRLTFPFICFLFSSYSLLLFIIYLAFISLGLSDSLIGCASIYHPIIHSAPDNFDWKNSQAVIGIHMTSAYLGLSNALYTIFKDIPF